MPVPVEVPKPQKLGVADVQTAKTQNWPSNGAKLNPGMDGSGSDQGESEEEEEEAESSGWSNWNYILIVIWCIILCFKFKILNQNIFLF